MDSMEISTDGSHMMVAIDSEYIVKLIKFEKERFVFKL